MIIPIFFGFRDFSRAPMTWVLVGLCLFIYLSTLTMEPFYRSPLLEKRQLQFTGILYLQFLQRSDVPGPSELLLLGGRALRDPSFLQVSPTYAFTGDDREITQWRGHLKTYIEKTESRSIFKFGLRRNFGEGIRQPLTWITYQFMHADALHLLGNLVFLILFGVAIEALCGAMWVAGTFLGGGIVGGLFSLLVEGATSLPMVGASASISALMAFYMMAEVKKRVRFFYFFSPFREFYGDVYMSKWWIAPLCLLPDLGNWIAERALPYSDLMAGQIATSAHLGGALLGLFLGWLVRPYISGANPRRTVFSVTHRGSMN